MNIKAKEKSLPSSLAQIISGCKWRQIHIGLSSAQVFRLDAKNKDSFYLKIDSGDSKFVLRREKLVLNWLENRLPVPKVLTLEEDENNSYLLLSEVSGTPAIDNLPEIDIPQTIEQITNGLKMIHGLPIENCPFDARLDQKIERACERMHKGLVEEDDFDEERKGRTAEDLFRELLETKPTDEDLVFTHGDYCLPNIIFENGKLSGFVDWSGAGVADRYQDIALLTRSVWYNFGEDWTKKVFEIYGIEPDWEKIRFYQLLDEFF